MIPITFVGQQSDIKIEFKNSIDTYKFLLEHGHFIFDPYTAKDNDLNLLNLVSENKKIFISGGVGPFHIIFDTIFPIMNISRVYDDVEFIVDIYELRHRNNLGFVDMIKDYLSNYINIRIIDTTEFDGVVMNNYFLLNNGMHVNQFDKGSIEKNVPYFLQGNPVAEKRVYVSRKKYQWYSHVRISEESQIEDLFIKNGFEVVYPEDFGSIHEQIVFFSKVKTIASLSSSGLAWMIFMQPGGNVLELQTSFPNLPDAEMLHQQYHAIAYTKDLSYHSISNYDKISESLIKKIENSKILTII